MKSSRVWAWVRRASEQPRLLLAAKTAAAAALSWYLAPLLPFTDDDYSYYAPLGVLVSMYPTLLSSVRSGLQSLAALAIGIGLGLAVIAVPMPRVVGMLIVVGVGVLLAGIRFLGSSNSWVPIAALFVLLLGGRDPEDYSLNYLVNVLFGIVVGAVVNFAIAPPVPMNAASEKLNTLRDRVASHLKRLAEALAQASANRGGWSAAMQRLDETADDVRRAMQHADESRRANPRGRRTRAQLDEDYERLRSLERVLFLVRDVTDVLSQATVTGEDESSAVVLRADVSNGIRAVAELVATPASAEESPRRLREAENAVAALASSADKQFGQPSKTQDAVTVSLALRRIIDAARPFVAADDNKEQQ